MKYRKVYHVEAYQFWNRIGEDNRPAWVLEAINRGDIWFQGGDVPYLTIKTPEGEMRADLGDWIIKGAGGEIYPCKPDIFEATYEAVEEEGMTREEREAQIDDFVKSGFKRETQECS